MDDKISDEVRKQLEDMKQWASTQPLIPKDIEDRILLRFIHSCYYDLEKAKVAADLFFSIRSASSELFTNRDPLAPAMQKTLQIVNLAQYVTSKNRNIWIWQLNDPGLDRYDYVQDAKLFMLASDSWLISNDFLEEGDLVIMDVKDVSLKFLTKFNLSVAKKLSKYQQEAIPLRLEQIHIVNAPPFIDKLYSLMKPFLKQEITNMVRFHAPDSTTLYDFISKEELPKDYGGELDKMEVFMKKSLDLFSKNREHFLNDNLWRVDKKSKNKDVSTEIGSFRSLAID
ncbi:alpha-tocopherol transfer protein-like [Manduca sexta]|uniref:CRAL-TRIO domain-containing protein n=1 Tax=Manduca sexta TaxID=7130 RepID=A0A922CC88_MANSE|nr:alpha-tocopherol transfer protein-like [Manduca sexta]XP_030029279.1 alpha-tocopherol transfer protein-like [Manduca sexta]XP_030029288.1 alpha-tocopherol transfer protein-like [Manduca sexta]KAG6441575.1 hypothetical protein O3G_MSEX001881 [Manduca sexta]